jgi:hypothetical protein
MPEQEWETVHGVRVVKGWGAKLAAAQLYYPAIRLAWRGPVLCPDCAAARGELHVPSCDQELCPWCREQLIGCSCEASRHLRVLVDVTLAGH